MSDPSNLQSLFLSLDLRCTEQIFNCVQEMAD